MLVNFAALAHQCAPNVDPVTLQALVKTESGFNPFAIGVVGGHLVRQPRSAAEAVATAKALDARGIDFSMGLGQVNKRNLAAYGLDYASVFDACANLRAGGSILTDCYRRSAAAKGQGTGALYAALSCYYSGNFARGFVPDLGGTSYVQRVAANASNSSASVELVPAIPVVPNSGESSKPATAGSATPEHRATSSAQGPSFGRPDNTKFQAERAAWDAFGEFSSPK